MSPRAALAYGRGMKIPDRVLAQALLRWCLGFNLIGHGLNRIGHPRQFAEGMANEFAHTFLPQFLVLAFGFALPFLEPLLGFCLVTGFHARWALIFGALLTSALSFGTALLGRWDVLTQQLVYAVVYFLLISGLAQDTLRPSAQHVV
jgi:thiosulfate dehydrogenase (quinone) large subunit